MSIPRDPLRHPPPPRPGEMLRDEFMVPFGLSAHALALALRVPATRISEIVAERRGITADTAYRLALYFSMTPDFWMNLQSSYELSLVAHKDYKDYKELKKEVSPRVA